jgi:glycosyltransferase involved in cell wall biosynthesis
MTNQQWDTNRLLFLEKYQGNLPIKLESNYPINKINPKIPLVSIIIPIYNYGIQFEKTLQSAFDSTYKNIEVVIVNDGSTDEYVKLKLESIKDHPNIKIIYQENQGPSSARNNGIKNSNGDLILPLDADDMIQPEYIQSCVNILKNNKNISPVYCDTHHIGETQGVESRPEWSIERLNNGPFIVNCSMFHRKAFEDCNGYDEELKGWEDYDLWIRMGLKGYSGKRIPKPLFIYFHHESDGTVSTEANSNQQELYNKIMNKNYKNEN